MGNITKGRREMGLGHFLADNNQLAIPIFQREYSWRKPQILSWNEDLIHYTDLNIERPDESQPHFCGTMIFRDTPTESNQINIKHLIDGQQRFVTTFLILLALVRKFALEYESGSPLAIPEFKVDHENEDLINFEMEDLQNIYESWGKIITHESVNTDDQLEIIKAIIAAQEKYKDLKRNQATPDDFVSILKEYILFDTSKKEVIKGNSNLRLCLSKDDRPAINAIIDELLNIPAIKNKEGIPEEKGGFWSFQKFDHHEEYSLITSGWNKYIKPFIDNEWEKGQQSSTGGVERLKKLQQVLTEEFKVIEILLDDYAQVTTILTD